MLFKVKMILMSNLSDVQEEIGAGDFLNYNGRLNFIKYLILNYPNTNVEIDVDMVYKEFEKKHLK